MLNLMKKFVIPFLLFFIGLNSVTAQDIFLKNGRFIDRHTGKAFTGIYKEVDSSNRVTVENSIKDGLPDGNTFLYYPSGAKKELRTYNKGKKDGVWKTWNDTGVQTAEAGFKNGLKDGNWYVWDDNGVKRYEMFYIQGVKKGTWIIRDEKGTEISREDFK